MAGINININGRELVGQKGQTILEVARENEIHIPTLCYDKRIEIYGGCGLCVVEIQGSPKLFRACATEISPGMIVKTNTERIRESRKTTLELLLTDHTGDCRPPCVLACPGMTDCQGYVGLIANGEFEEALKLIKEQLPLPASIGRVCPHPCEEACRRQLKDEPISIAWLKRFVADLDLKDPFIPSIDLSTGKKVAIVGGGPGGLTAAYYLRQKGHAVTIYDMMPEMGGMLKYGIPEYRLPKNVVDEEASIIKDMGVDFKNNMKLGNDISLDYLRAEYDAVFLSIGCWNSISLKCPGEELKNVYGGIHFLANVIQHKPVFIGKKVAVIGGGNTAMDACRSAIRLGAEDVYVLYRRTREEMPAEEIEIIECEEEGIQFKFLVSPLEMTGENGEVKAIRLQKMKLGEPDASGRRRPVPIENEEETIHVDSIIVAIGQYVNVGGLDNIELTKRETIASDENTFSTSLPGVFAGGDAINNNQKIAIQAIGDAKKAAAVIHSYLNGRIIPYTMPYLVTREDVEEDEFSHRPTAPRPLMEHLSPEERKSNFLEIVKGYTDEAAIEDAKRCLECGCHDYFECKLLKYSKDYSVNPKPLMGVKHERNIRDTHPFITRNPDKCILCGLCVRMCHEVMGITALGLVDRGFDTIVKPDMDRPLENTDCISCGQCISVCPTGALQERLQIPKPCPIETKKTSSICSFCSLGCGIDFETRGKMVVRALPSSESKVGDGLLCVKGRFGYSVLNNDQRIVKPMIRKNGSFVETDLNEALFYAAKKLESLQFRYGNDSIAVSISDQWTSEEIFVAKRFGEDVLKTTYITNFNMFKSGLNDVFGLDASPNTLDEIEQTNVVLVIGSNTYKNHTIAGVKIKKALGNGAKLITVNPSETKLDEWADLVCKPANDIAFLHEVISALIRMGFTPKCTAGFETLKESLKEVIPGDDATKIADMYGNARKAMIIFDQNNLSTEAIRLCGYISLISGHIGKPRDGIIQLKPQNNSQTLPIVGIKKEFTSVIQAIQNEQIKGLFVCGENYLPSVSFSKPEFMVFMGTHLSETAQMADVLIPANIFTEKEGTYISTDRKVQHFTSVLPSALEKNTWETLQDFSNILKGSLNYRSVDQIWKDLVRRTNGTFDRYWFVGDSPVLYENSYFFEDGLARFNELNTDALFVQKDSTNLFMQKLNSFLKENKLARF